MKKNIIKVTDNAIKQLKKILNKTNFKEFELSLKNGGCNGYKYNLKPIISNNNKHFETYKKENVKINICNKSLMYLIGTEVDWKDEIITNGFTYNNPNVKYNCGCGKSFIPKK